MDEPGAVNIKPHRGRQEVANGPVKAAEVAMTSELGIRRLAVALVWVAYLLFIFGSLDRPEMAFASWRVAVLASIGSGMLFGVAIRLSCWLLAPKQPGADQFAIYSALFISAATLTAVSRTLP